MNGEPITPEDLAELIAKDPAQVSAWLEGQRKFASELRRANEALADAMKAKNPKRQREACIISLVAVSQMLMQGPLERRSERLHRPFRALAEALDSFNKGANPDFLSREFSGGKAVGTSGRVLPAIAAAACIQILEDAGEPKKTSRHRVAEIFADAGHVTSVGKRITSRTLKGWFDAGLAPLDAVASRVEFIRAKWGPLNHRQQAIEVTELLAFAVRPPEGSKAGQGYSFSPW